MKEFVISDKMNFENEVDAIIRKSNLSNYLNDNNFHYYGNSYMYLYKDCPESELLATLHAMLNTGLDALIKREVSNGNRYLNANNSRLVLYSYQAVKSLQSVFSKFGIPFFLEDKYTRILDEIIGQVNEFRGSSIIESPLFSGFYTDRKKPIFHFSEIIQIETNRIKNSELSLIGSGSYGMVYKFYDYFMDSFFALKKINKDSTEKEVQRFKQEFDILKNTLISPYIIDVFKYDEKDNSYIMELMDGSLEKPCQDDSVDNLTRRSIALQVLKAMSYLHSKNIVHRDICPSNFLYKKYDDGTYVVKLADLGIAKVPTSNISSEGTNAKGHFIDPELNILGFNNAEPIHDLIGVAHTIMFILTGKGTSENKLFSDLLDKVYSHAFKSVEDIKSYCRSTNLL